MRTVASFVVVGFACMMRESAPCTEAVHTSGIRYRFAGPPRRQMGDELHKDPGLLGSEGILGGNNAMSPEYAKSHGAGLLRSRNRWHSAPCNKKNSKAKCSLGAGDGSEEGEGNLQRGRDSWGNHVEEGRDNNARTDPTGMAKGGFDGGLDSATDTSVQEFLTLELMVPTSQLGKLFDECPQLLRLSVTKNLRPAAQSLMSRGISASVLRKAVISMPRLLSHHVSHNAGKVLDFLLEIGCPQGKLGRVISKAWGPKLLALSVEKNLRPTVSFLCDDIKVLRGEIWRMVESCPEVLTRSLHKQLLPACLFLENVGIQREKLGAFIGAYPQALCKSIERKLCPVIDYLVNAVGVPREKIGHVLLKKPQILGYSTEKMQRVITFLTVEVGVSSEGVRDMVLRFPSFLGYSVETNLRPTVSYICEMANVKNNELARELVTFPQMLSYSLERRLKPRLEYLRSFRVHLNKGRFSISKVLRQTDSQFHRTQSHPLLLAALNNGNETAALMRED